MVNHFWDSDEISAEEISDEMEEAQQILAEEDFDDDSELITNARLRLEQGKLYEMLLKHDLFGSIDADPKAVQNVQKEIRNFIKERLEVLLGLKPDPRLRALTQTPQAQTEMPFTALEIDLLKRFLAKMSKGATEQVGQAQSSPPLISSPAPRQETIRPLSSGPSQRPVPAKATASRPSKSQASKPKSPAPQPQPAFEDDLEEEQPLNRPASSLTASELIERNKRISQRQAARKSAGPNRTAVLSPDQEAMIMMQHVAARNESLKQDGVTPLNIAINKALQSKAE